MISGSGNKRNLDYQFCSRIAECSICLAVCLLCVVFGCGEVVPPISSNLFVHTPLALAWLTRSEQRHFQVVRRKGNLSWSWQSTAVSSIWRPWPSCATYEVRVAGGLPGMSCWGSRVELCREPPMSFSTQVHPSAQGRPALSAAAAWRGVNVSLPACQLAAAPPPPFTNLDIRGPQLKYQRPDALTRSIRIEPRVVERSGRYACIRQTGPAG